MHPASASIPTPSQFLTFLVKHPKRWLLPALGMGMLASLYALVRPNTWEATQALILRNEAATAPETPGKFAHTDDMKTVQETILELVKSRGVLAEALAKVGPPPAYRGPLAAWPRPIDVEDLRDALKITPPKGAEFGKTEVFYLQVRDSDRDRAIALVEAVSQQLEARFQQVRNAKAQSMVDELVKAVKLARDDLAESTTRLAALETQVGSDLAELRMLHESSSGESALRRTVTEIHAELRQVQASKKANDQLLALLEAAQNEPGRLLATPNALLESQPALRRLKEGLIDAQLRTAELAGRRSESHPLVLAANEAEAQIRQHLHREVENALRAIRVDAQLAAERERLLNGQLAEATGRLNRLAGLRAEYANLVAEARHRGGLLERAEQKLAEARIAQATAQAASLIGRIDTPDAGIRPIGPGRMVVALSGLAGGLMAGLGVVALTFPLPRSVPPTSFTAPPDVAEVHGHANGRTNGYARRTTLSLNQALQRITRR